MNNIKINNQEVEVKEYQGQRVVTFKDIDLVHNNLKGISRKNFQNNKRHFVEGEDYILISQKELGEKFTQSYGFGKNAPSGTLITESGYLMIAKSLTDDLAWQVQRELVKNYFRKSTTTLNNSTSMTIAPKVKIYGNDPIMLKRELEYFIGHTLDVPGAYFKDLDTDRYCARGSGTYWSISGSPEYMKDWYEQYNIEPVRYEVFFYVRGVYEMLRRLKASEEIKQRIDAFFGNYKDKERTYNFGKKVAKKEYFDILNNENKSKVMGLTSELLRQQIKEEIDKLNSVYKMIS